MFSLKHFNLRVGLLLLAALVSDFPLTAHADITGQWDLSGTLRVNSTVGSKAVALKKTALRLYAGFTSNESLNQMVLSSNAPATVSSSVPSLELSGLWTEAKSTYAINPDASTIRSLFRIIEKDLHARSGVEVNLEETKIKFTGRKRKNGTISGTLSIKAKAFLLGPTVKNGSLTVTYTFTGIRKMD